MSDKVTLQDRLANIKVDLERIKQAAGKERALAEKGLQDNDKYRDEILTLNTDRLKYEVEELRNKLDREIDTHDLRKQYVPLLFRLIVVWLAIVVLFVFMTGWSGDFLNNPDCRINCARFKLNDSVLIAFITSTTFSVLGLFLLVAKWLYPSGDTKSDKEKKEG